MDPTTWARRDPGAVSTSTVVALAAAAWLGAWIPFDPTGPVRAPVAAVGAVTAVSVARRRPVVAVVALAMLAGGLAASAEAGRRAPLPSSLEGNAVLVSDMVRSGSRWKADVRLGGRRYRVELTRSAIPEGKPGSADTGSVGVAGARSGDVIWLSGPVRPLTPFEERYFGPRHLAGLVRPGDVDYVGRRGLLTRVVGRARDLLAAGADAAGLRPSQRALLLGLTVGDDRDQEPAVAESLAVSGLTHLSAVSGQNVALVLVLVGPVVARGGPRRRFVSIVAVLVTFGTLTRWEPSVLRAVTMAGIGALATTVGRPIGGLRLLAVAVGALVLIDPLLVHRLGFVLSVAASAGITVMADPLRRRLPGPEPLRAAMAVTLAAQAAVSPILVAAFGPVSPASVPANLLAGPVAGLTMAWGMVAGLGAGLLAEVGGGGAARVLHAPTAAGTGWIVAVADIASSWELPRVGPPGAWVSLTLVAWTARPRGRPGGGRRR